MDEELQPISEESENNVETAEPQTEVGEQQEQTPEVNSAFADLRRQKETYEKELQERDKWFAENFKDYGVSNFKDYQVAMQKQIEEQQKKAYEDMGVDYSEVEKLINNNPIVKEANQLLAEQKEQQAFNVEAGALFSAIPNLKVEDIPNEVLQIRAEKNIPLLYAYKAYMFDNVKSKTEQEVIQKINKNNSTAVGSLNNGSTPIKPSIKDMSAKDFKALQEKVLRGEVTDF